MSAAVRSSSSLIDAASRFPSSILSTTPKATLPTRSAPLTANRVRRNCATSMLGRRAQPRQAANWRGLRQLRRSGYWPGACYLVVSAQQCEEARMGSIREIVFDCETPSALARFWAELLDGYAVRPYDEAEIDRLAGLGLTPETDPTVLVDGPGPMLCFQQCRRPQIREQPRASGHRGRRPAAKRSSVFKRLAARSCAKRPATRSCATPKATSSASSRAVVGGSALRRARRLLRRARPASFAP